MTMFLTCSNDCRVEHGGRVYLFEDFGYVYKVDDDLAKAAIATGKCTEVKDYKGSLEIPSSTPQVFSATARVAVITGIEEIFKGPGIEEITGPESAYKISTESTKTSNNIPENIPVTFSPELTWAEEVEITCYPYKVAVKEAWDKCVAAARLAAYHNLSSLEEAKKTVQYIDLARQHLILSRLAATAPWDGTPNVATN